MEIKVGSARVVAGDLQSTFQAVDEAIINGVRLFGSVVETARASNVLVAESQRLYDDVVSGLQSVVKGRADIVGAMKKMNVLKRNSNLETVDIGCANPLRVLVEPMAEAESRPLVSVG